MKRVEVALLAVAIAFLGTGVARAYYTVGGDHSWLYRTPIHIDYTKVGANLTDFPVLVALTSTNFDFSHARSDGYDIRFTLNEDGTGVLKYERERHDSTNQVAEYWVKIPSVSSASDTYFYMFSGNASASDGQDKTNVWDSNFRMVQHLHETSGTHYDSTSNANNGTCYGGVSQGSAGKIDNADYFDGTDDYVGVSDNATLDITDAITLEAWLNGTGSVTGNITKGTTMTHDSDQGLFSALCEVDNTHYLCAYSDILEDLGRAKILTVDRETGTVTGGTAHTFDTTDNYAAALCQVDYTHYLCVYEGMDDDGYAVILTVNTGDWTVSSGTKKEFDTVNGVWPALSAIDSTRYLCAYQGSGSSGRAVVLTVNTSDWTITVGTPHTFDANSCWWPALSNVDSTRYLCAYEGVDDDGFAVVLTVNTGSWTVSSGTKHEFDTTECWDSALSRIDSTHHLCAYEGPDGDGYALVFTVNTGDSTVSSGTKHEFDTTRGQDPALTAIDGTHYLCTYVGDGTVGDAVVLTVNTGSWTVSSGTAFEFESTDFTWQPGLCKIDNIGYLCTYERFGEGYAVILNVEWGPIAWKGSDGYSLGIDGGSGADSLFGVTGFINDHSLTVDVSQTWHHLALTYDRSNMRLYVDGSEQHSVSYTTAISTNAENLKVGNKVNGTADEVRVSATARTATWLEACYNNQSSPATFCILGTETLAAIAHVGVQGSDSEVVLEWETDAEVGTAGFNVLRAESPEGPWVKLNEELIPSRGSSWQGASYAFSDQSRQAGAVYWYCVEEVDTRGGTSQYPVQLVWDDGLTDADGDGMPDAWEERLGIDGGSDADAGADADEDGATNLEEYLAGTSPVDGEDCPRLWIEREESRNLVVLTWPARAGRTYRVLAADSLTELLDGSPTVLSVVPATSHSLLKFECNEGPESGRRFYRLIISPPR